MVKANLKETWEKWQRGEGQPRDVETTPEEAKLHRDKGVLERAPKVDDKATATQLLGVDSDNYDAIQLNERGIDYFKEMIKDLYDSTWAEIKKTLDIKKIRTILDLKESDLKEIWNSEKKIYSKAQKSFDGERKEFEKKEQVAIKIFSRKGQAEEFKQQQPFFYDKAGLWWLWNNEKLFWELTDEVDILNMIEGITGTDIISSRARNELLNSLKQEGRKYVPKPAAKSWIQFKNGIVDVSSPEIILLMPNCSYFITNPIPWDLGEKEETPIMDTIFEQWVGKENVHTLHEILAYCLLPDYPVHRIFCFIGAGLNGKSCFLNLLKKFVGNHNVTCTELDVLLESRFEITRLHRKLVCQMGETNFSEINRTSVLKRLSGGDLIGFEYKRADLFEDMNYAKILISTNNLPTTSDKTIGFYRRWMIIDFPNTFSEKKDILAEIPDEEYENLARKSVKILRDLLKKREFTNEGSVEERVKRYEDKSNPLEKFIKEFTEEDYGSYVWKWEFEKRLNAWCKENRFRQIADHTIGKRMKEMGVEQSKRQADWLINANDKRLRTWEGLKWKQ